MLHSIQSASPWRECGILANNPPFPQATMPHTVIMVAYRWNLIGAPDDRHIPQRTCTPAPLLSRQISTSVAAAPAGTAAACRAGPPSLALLLCLVNTRRLSCAAAIHARPCVGPGGEEPMVG